MIKIENLSKIYSTKNKATCAAIKDINLVLPDKGMVFILGKSGSGKSTLLNLIGGLDAFDGGDIICYGNSLKSFRPHDYESYRSDFVSFIFQDYHLLDELTVLENITLFSKDDDELLQQVLQTVEMQDYINKYPSELSGGQRQRVAIARGIMKKPKMLLCDEPTGNLDRKTSLHILDLLKKISREKLVLIVSHNLNEAQTYADRIIELADGRIVEDTTKYDDYEDRLFLEDGHATLPHHKPMSDGELQALNQTLSEGKLQSISVNESGFYPSANEYTETKQPLVRRKAERGKTLELFKKFFFAKKWNAISAIFLSVLMFAVFAVIQSFLAFDTTTALLQVVAGNQSTIALEQDYSDFPKNIRDDLSPFDGETTYPFYSQTIWTDNKYNSSWDTIKRMTDKKNFSDFFIRENYGLLLCDEQYLIDLYGKDGQIPLLAGSLQNERGTGILITDYFADSILYHDAVSKRFEHFSYQDIIGVFNPASGNTAGYICGIIDTGYKTIYQPIMAQFESVLMGTSELTLTELQKQIATDPLYMQFLDDVKMHLGIGFCLNPNYIDAFSLSETSIVKTKDFYFSANGKEISDAKLNFMSTSMKPLKGSDFADNEIAIPYTLYNKLFDTNYESSDCKKLNHVPPKTVVIKKYEDDNPNKAVLFQREFLITCLTVNKLYANENVMMYFKQCEWQPSRIYIKNTQNLSTVVDFMEQGEYHFVSSTQQSCIKIYEIVSTVNNLFVLLEVAVFAMIFLYLVSFGIKSIRQNSYQIGVMKALGVNTRNIGSIFVCKTFAVGLITALLSTLCAVPFLTLANSVLISSMETSLKLPLKYFTIIHCYPVFLWIDAASLLMIAVFSALIPSLLLKRIKPIDIIKAKE